ncbi:MAG: hypothetical protein NKF70_10165 [Methanobacterium sp. ERen5]|nr:MAG: hypothetical protein NKF70_10165 [Methanobacterium sp. ERen5]
MKKYSVTICGFITVLILVLAVSGCISQPGKNEKLIYELNATQKIWNSNEGSPAYNVTIPNEAKSVKIKYNVSKEFTGAAMGLNLGKYSELDVDAFNIILEQGHKTPHYSHNQIDSKTVQISDNQYTNGIIEFQRSDIKGLIISPSNLQGKIEVYITY